MMRTRLGDGVADKFAPLLVLITLAVVATIAPAGAQLSQAKSTEIQKTQEGASAQKQIDQLDDERANLEAEYKVALNQLEDLKEYNAQLQELIKSQAEEKVSLRTQIDRVTGVGREIVPLMNDMLESLEEFVSLDVPFLLDERKSRVNNLKSLMKRSDVTDSEKYRSILEAYQIENDYGRTIEAYDGTVEREGAEPLAVTFLKVGRVSFMYQTRDGSESYVWNQAGGAWDELPGSYRTPVTIATRMAREQIPPDLIFIPVFAPEQSN